MKTKKILITTGYMFSGSSAVTDLISEYNDYSNINKTQEFVFLHCPNGIFDLENKLLLPPSCLSSKTFIKEFRDMMEKLYYFEGWWPSYYNESVSKDFLKYVDDFIDEITDLKFRGFWYMDEMPKKNTIVTKFKNYYKKKILKKRLFDDIEMQLSFPDKERYYNASKKLIGKVVDGINKDGLDNVIIDQLLLPHNLYRMDNYFDNAKAIVVERDPRDVYLINKRSDKINSGQVPYPYDAKNFCKMYRLFRESEVIINSKNILRIHFEDLIYDYDNTVKKICDFLDLDEKKHINKFLRFNPEKSVQNTQLFNDTTIKEDIKVIEKELNEYLYKFPYKYQNENRNIF